MAGVEEISSKYASELNELRCNSKPLINSLTMMAEDYIRHAPVIVQIIENHLRRVKPELKLPVLYLIDSIVQNVKKEYVNLFVLNIFFTFTLTFKQVNEEIKSQMWELRQTWNDVFQTKMLYLIDYECHQTDPGWLITAAPPSTASIHVNPKFLRTPTSTSGTSTVVNSTVASLSSAAPTLTASALSELVIPHVPAFSMEPPGDVTEAQMREQLLMKEKELLELQTKKLELELLHTKAQLEERTRELNEFINKQPVEAQKMPQGKIQLVSDLVIEYDEDRCRDPNPAALHQFVQKLKLIVNEGTEISRNDGRNYGNSESNRNGTAATSSLSESSPQADASDSNTNQKVIVEALGNHVILKGIFKCGNFHDFKTFRLVNKYWKDIANSVIIQRRLWKLKLKGKFSWGYDGSRNDDVLVQLNDCIEASGGSFPLTTLDLSDVGFYNSMDGAALLRFYDLIGKSIKHVVFNNLGPLTMDEFQDLLFNKMPNLDHIDAGDIVITNGEECQLPIVLPNLKTIRFIGKVSRLPCQVLPYYKFILLAAINLKEIQDFHFSLTDIVSETGKMGCIQALKLDFSLEESETCHVQFSHSEPKLTSLTITGREYEDYEFKLSPELTESLKRILNSSKDTLKHLRCLSRILPVDFELPKFSNLEFLSVFILEDAHDCNIDQTHTAIFFPSTCDCSEIFPKLHTVALGLGVGVGTAYEALSDYFPGQALASVKTLEFQESYHFGIGRLFKMVFPNVCHIKIIDHEYIAEDARLYPGLINRADRGFNSDLGNEVESLELNQCVLACKWKVRAFQLDSVFTGVPRHRCGRLLGMYNKRKARGEDEDMRVVKNILEAAQTQDGNRMFRNSEGLRRIKVNFNHSQNVNFRMLSMSDDCDVDSRDRRNENNCYCERCPEHSEDEDEDVKTPRPVITPVSCVYGFSLMPNLEQVIIGYDHTLPNAADIAQFFQPFAGFPYVKIAHTPTDWNDYYELACFS